MAITPDTEKAASIFDEMAAELEAAATHANVAASHMRNGDVPRYAAHAFAAIGHISNAKEQIDHAARLHARKAVAEP